MNFHHCLFNILKKNQNVTDERTERRTDNVKTVYPPTHTHTNIVCGGYKKRKEALSFLFLVTAFAYTNTHGRETRSVVPIVCVHGSVCNPSVYSSHISLIVRTAPKFEKHGKITIVLHQLLSAFSNCHGITIFQAIPTREF